MNIRDRILRLDRVPAGELLPNPKNWRVHPESQQNALRGILSEVGFVDAIMVRETPAGLQIVDGHLRAETAADSMVPVLVVDLDDAEADKILAVFDPLGAMATTDAAALDAVATRSRDWQRGAFQDAGGVGGRGGAVSGAAGSPR